MLSELYYLTREDIDYSAITWYYALCLEFQLDAAMILESYETCHDFYTNVVGKKSSLGIPRRFVSRDDSQLPGRRLACCATRRAWCVWSIA